MDGIQSLIELEIVNRVMDRFDAFGFKEHMYPNAIGMWKEEQSSLVYACTLADPNKDWIEIGSFMGGSAVLMCLAKRAIGGIGKVISVDIDFSAFQGAFNRNVYRVGKFQDIHSKLEMSSFELADTIKNLNGTKYEPKYSLAFIDGWHSFKGVLTDFNTIDEYMGPGGIVLFHDTYPQPYPEGKLLEFTINMYKHYDEWWSEELPGNNKFTSQQEYYQAEKKQNFRIDEAIAFILEKRPYELISLPTIHGQTHFDRVKEYIHGTTSPYPGIVAIRKLEEYK